MNGGTFADGEFLDSVDPSLESAEFPRVNGQLQDVFPDAPQRHWYVSFEVLRKLMCSVSRAFFWHSSTA